LDCGSSWRHSIMLANKVKELVEAFSAPNASDTDLENISSKIVRLLSSNTHYFGGQQSFDTVLQNITQLLNRDDSKNHEKSLYFLEIAHQLQSSPHVRHKGELLKVLQLLSGHSQIASHSDLMTYRESNPLLTSTASSHTFSSALRPPPPSHPQSSSFSHARPIHSRIGEDTHHRTLASSLSSSSTHHQHHQPPPPPTQQQQQQHIVRPYASNKLQREQYVTDLVSHPLHRLDAPSNSTFVGRGLKGEIVDELLLIRDILYACQGIETQFIETRNDEYAAKSTLRLLPSHKRLIRRLCDIGTLHERLTQFIRRHRDYEHITATTTSHLTHHKNKQQQQHSQLQHGQGLVLQSFLGALDEELTNLYHLFGCLHEKLQHSFDVHCKTEERMTLQRLAIWFEEPRRRLCLLDKFCRAVDGARGGMIISQIYKFCRSGNEFEYAFTECILNEICRPIFDMVTKWIIEGVLNDPFQEFFIVKREHVKLRDIWKQKYVLVRKYIPIFIAPSLAQKIYAIGRNLNFIRVCCKDTTFAPLQELHLHHEFELHFDVSHLNEFEEQIDRLSQVTNARLMQLMMDAFKVMQHAEALRKYLLLGQGDFIGQLLLEIREEMGKSAAMIKVHDIQSKLESAMLQSNALYHDNDIRQRLKVKLLTASSGDIGWNVFTLHYHVELPINIIFNESVMKKYQRVFVFLMKIKLAKSVLNESWLDQMRGSHHVSVFPDVHYVRHCAYLVRNAMNELLQIVESYFMFDVLEASWTEFEHNAHESRDMDGLIASHSKYINEIMKKCFLNSEDEQKLKRPLEDILSQIHQFTSMMQQLAPQLQSIQHKREQKLAALRSTVEAEAEDQNAVNVRDSYVGPLLLPSSMSGAAQHDAEYTHDYNHLRKTLNEIVYVLQSFHKKISKLLEISKTNRVIPEYLERLLVQLDFNDFHGDTQLQPTKSHSQQQQQAQASPWTQPMDLPINPNPLETFLMLQQQQQKKHISGVSNNKGLKKHDRDLRKSSSTQQSMSSSSSSSRNHAMKDYSQQSTTHNQANDMLSKLDAALAPTKPSQTTQDRTKNSASSSSSSSNQQNSSSSGGGGGSSSSTSFIPNFVFPSFGTGAETTKTDAPAHPPKTHPNFVTEEHRTTAPSSMANHDWSTAANNALVPTPLKSAPDRSHDILAKYNLGTPQIDATIPEHLLPTPLQRKVSSKTGDTRAHKYLLDDSVIDTSSANARGRARGNNAEMAQKRSRSSSPRNHHLWPPNEAELHTNGSGYIDDDHFDAQQQQQNAENINQKANGASPSDIKFSFGHSPLLMSPIPFPRNPSKMESDKPDVNMDGMSREQWNKFIPTPLMNQRHKTKTFRG